MKREDHKYKTYIQILEKELIPAMGCTEPIALAFCGAKAREQLLSKENIGKIKKIHVEVSNNIIKNVKSVIVPNTQGKKGIEAAVAIGVVAGDSAKGLEVISKVNEEEKKKTADFLNNVPIEVEASKEDIVLNIIVTIFTETEMAKIQVVEEHTNVVLVSKNEDIILDKRDTIGKKAEDAKYKTLNVKDIFDFATTVDIEEIREVIQRQIDCNEAIAKEGLTNNYGANIGKVLLKTGGSEAKNIAKAMAAAASDARMNGCELPVVINSGSGNQGATTSLPVIVYAKKYNVPEEMLFRALVLSNLVTIYQKSFIGRLSAFCGVVSAGAGASAGIALLTGGGYEQVIHSIVNTLGIASGMVCDGAKSSCAAKIATAVEAGILGYEMYKNGQEFYGGDGVVANNVEETIQNIGQLGKYGMYETDREIIKIMIEKV